MYHLTQFEINELAECGIVPLDPECHQTWDGPNSRILIETEIDGELKSGWWLDSDGPDSIKWLDPDKVWRG
jgi:hypothetical protein